MEEVDREFTEETQEDIVSFLRWSTDVQEQTCRLGSQCVICWDLESAGESCGQQTEDV